MEGGASAEMVEHLVVFADALGTRSHQDTPERSHEFLEHLLSGFSRSSRRLELAQRHAQGFRYRWFSDNVSLCVPIFNAEDLVLALQTAAQIQLEFLLAGVLLRGAATVGLHYNTPEVDYGPALTEAATMEEKDAVYPRIVLSPGLVQRIRSVDELRALALVDPQDQKTYLHFMHLLDRGALMAARDAIERLLDAAQGPSQRSKVEWLAGYFNHTHSRPKVRRVPRLQFAPL